MTNIVQDLLVKKGIPFKVSGKDFMISCLSPEHEDNNPSCRVDKTTGIFHCFSCGFKGNLFKYFGVITSNNSIKIQKLKEKLKELSVSFNGVDFPFNKIPFNKKFRNISVKTLKEFEAFYTTEKEELNDRIFFPITDIRGKVSAYIGRHTMSMGNPRYLVYPPHSKLVIFPEVLKEPSKSIILVEGLFDFLNLYDNGLKNVACTFGTSTLFKDTALKMLPFKTQGVTHVYIMYDGDAPGQEATQKLKPLLEEAEFIVDTIQLEEDRDPGDLSSDEIQSIKEWINENSNNRQSA